VIRAAGGRWLAAAAPVCAGIASVLFSWQRWINPFVDGSREMIVPARLAAGERLYADVAYLYGPAAPYLNALPIKLLGRHIAVLEGMGLLFSSLLFFCLFRLTARVAGTLSAAAATTLAAALCLGAPNGGAFVYPYSFGTLFALAGVFVALEAISGPLSRGKSTLAVAGLALAMTAKPEMGAAAAIVILVAAVRSGRWRESLPRDGRIVLFAVVLAACVYAIAFQGLSWEVSNPEGPITILSPPQEWLNVYRVISGMADPASSFSRVATALFLDVVLLGAAAGFAVLGRRKPGRALASTDVAWGILVLAAVLFFLSPYGSPIEDRLPPLLAPMPLVALGAAAFELRSPLSPEGRARFLLFGFSALFGMRVLLGLTYGAYTTPYSILALPGLCATAAVLVLDRLAIRLPDVLAFRRTAALLFAALAVVGVARLYRLRPPSATVPVQTGAGTLRLAPDKAWAVLGTLDYVRARAGSSDTLVGFPETGLFNFATGLRNPLRQDVILPAMLDATAEQRVIRRLQEAPPGFVLLANQPTPAFGPISFGRDYAVRLWEAVERSYRLAASFGDAPPNAPVGDPRFFIRVYERRRETGP
jgi:hypothetical protein